MITPIEIRQQQFKKSLRGFDKDEVTAFLNTISLEWERHLEDSKRTKQELEKTTASLDSLRQVESALHKTLLQAEETSKATVENAKKDAELKLQESEVKARELVKQAIDERSRIEMQINELVARRNEILQQLKSYLLAQTERLKTFEEQEMKTGEVPQRHEAAVRPEASEPTHHEPVAETVAVAAHPEASIKVAAVKEEPVAVGAEARSFFETKVRDNSSSQMIDDIVDEL